jgi:hypothetical protein
MKRRFWMEYVLGGVLLGGCLGGCHKPAIREKPVPDPLLTSKKPIAGRTMGTDLHATPGEEWLPPPPPSDTDAVPPRTEGRIVRMIGLQ